MGISQGPYVVARRRSRRHHGHIFRDFRILFFLTFASISSHAQVLQTARFEIPFPADGSEFKVLPWERNGVIVYRRMERPKTDAIQFIKLDSSLHEQWTSTVEVSKQLSLLFSKGHHDKAYFLFKPRNFYGDFQLFSHGIDTSMHVVYTIKNVIPFNPTLFEVGNKTVVIAGYYNYRPVAIHFSMVTGQSKLLPGFFNDPGELNQLVLNEDESVDVVINMRNTERKRSLWVMSFSPEGVATKNTIIHPPNDKHLIYGRMVKPGADTTVIAGVYGRNIELSRGVFVASVNAAGEYAVRYYNFADLKNFFKYMRAGRQMRIKDRIDRRKIKGKRVRFNYRIAVHEFMPYQDHFVLIGEAFYPVYNNSSYSPMRSSPLYYGRYYFPGNTQQRDFTFDGYRYTHAVILGIAKDGHLVWDNSFEIRDLKSYTLNQYVHRLPGKNLNLLYSFNNKIFTKTISGTAVIEGKSEDQMKGMFDGDKIKDNSTTNHRLEYWYGPYLLSHGVQDINNTKTLGVALNRKVFFVSKITVGE
jgi:hypothetical protein